MAKGPSYTKQLIGSLVAAAIIALLTIALVTAKIGPGLDARELYDLDRGGNEQGDDDNSGSGR